MLVRRSMFVEVDGFDETFFMEWEDLDLVLAGVASRLAERLRARRAPTPPRRRRHDCRRGAEAKCVVPPQPHALRAQVPATSTAAVVVLGECARLPAHPRVIVEVTCESRRRDPGSRSSPACDPTEQRSLRLDDRRSARRHARLAGASAAARCTLVRVWRSRALRGVGAFAGSASRSYIVRVISGAEFKLKYSGSALGYVWSVVKPLGPVRDALHRLRPFLQAERRRPTTRSTCWSDSCSGSTSPTRPRSQPHSLVARSALLTKLSFPRLIIPSSVSTTTAITLGVNLLAVGVFVAFAGVITGRWSWLLIPPLLFELFLVTLGVGLFLSTLFVRLRDVDSGLGARAPADVLRLADHLPGRLPAPVVEADRLSQPTGPDHPGRRATRSSRRRRSQTAADVYGSPLGGSAPARVACASSSSVATCFFRRQAPSFAETDLSSVTPALELDGVTKSVSHPARASHDDQGILPPPLQAGRLRGEPRAERRHASRRTG